MSLPAETGPSSHIYDGAGISGIGSTTAAGGAHDIVHKIISGKKVIHTSASCITDSSSEDMFYDLPCLQWQSSKTSNLRNKTEATSIVTAWELDMGMNQPPRRSKMFAPFKRLDMILPDYGEDNSDADTQQSDPYNFIQTHFPQTNKRTFSISHPQERDQFGSNLMFVVTCAGWSVGLNNIWRFPYFALKNPGGSYLIPYLFASLLCYYPLLYMELMIGRYIVMGPIGVMQKICPLMAGLGIASILLSLIYFFITSNYVYHTLAHLIQSISSNETEDSLCIKMLNNNTSNKPSVVYTEQNSNEDERIPYTSDSAIYGLFPTYAICYLLLVGGLSLTSKIMYFTVLVPCTLLFMCSLWTISLKGGPEAQSYYFAPTKLGLIFASIQPWRHAFTQVLLDGTIGCGGYVTFGSYINYSKNNIACYSLLILAVKMMVDILSGLTVFSTLGAIANVKGTPIDQVNFTDYSVALHIQTCHSMQDTIPAMIFFLICIVFAVNTLSGHMIILFTTIIDLSYNKSVSLYMKRQFHLDLCVKITRSQHGCLSLGWLRAHYQQILYLIICAPLCVIMLTFVSQIIKLQNDDSALLQFVEIVEFCLLTVLGLESVTILWVYGTCRLSQNIQSIQRKCLSKFFIVTWAAAPIMLIVHWFVQATQVEKSVETNMAISIFGYILYVFMILLVASIAIKMLVQESGATCKERFLKSTQSTLPVDTAGGDQSFKDICNVAGMLRSIRQRFTRNIPPENFESPLEN